MATELTFIVCDEAARLELLDRYVRVSWKEDHVPVLVPHCRKAHRKSRESKWAIGKVEESCSVG